MEKYLFTSFRKTRRILFGYEDGVCREFKMEGPVGEEEMMFLASNFPWREEFMEYFETMTRGKITRMEQDLSFGAFWSAYGYKVGNKARVQKLWEKLSDAERAQAIRSIPLYDRFLLMKQNQDKLYPETYLRQRRFENNYKLY